MKNFLITIVVMHLEDFGGIMKNGTYIIQREIPLGYRRREKKCKKSR